MHLFEHGCLPCIFSSTANNGGLLQPSHDRLVALGAWHGTLRGPTLTLLGVCCCWRLNVPAAHRVRLNSTQPRACVRFIPPDLTLLWLCTRQRRWRAPRRQAWRRPLARPAGRGEDGRIVVCPAALDHLTAQSPFPLRGALSHFPMLVPAPGGAARPLCEPPAWCGCDGNTPPAGPSPCVAAGQPGRAGAEGCHF
jgi:hypothetical protein